MKSLRLRFKRLASTRSDLKRKKNCLSAKHQLSGKLSNSWTSKQGSMSKRFKLCKRSKRTSRLTSGKKKRSFTKKKIKSRNCKTSSRFWRTELKKWRQVWSRKSNRSKASKISYLIWNAFSICKPSLLRRSKMRFKCDLKKSICSRKNSTLKSLARKPMIAQ